MARRGRVGGAGVAHIVTCALTYGRGGLFFGVTCVRGRPGRSVCLCARLRLQSPAAPVEIGGGEERARAGHVSGARAGTCAGVSTPTTRGGRLSFWAWGSRAVVGRQGGVQGADAPAGRPCAPPRQAKEPPRAVLWPVASIATCRLPYPRASGTCVDAVPPSPAYLYPWPLGSGLAWRYFLRRLVFVP